MATTPDRRLPDATGDERVVLLGWLEWQRATVHRKCAGLDGATAYETLIPPSALTVASVVSHLRFAEWHWFEHSFLGHPAELEWGTIAETDGWRFEPLPLDRLLGNYAEQCARSRAIVAGHGFDELEVHAPPGIELVSLRWIVGHMVEETARHLGHVDLLREIADGATGY